MLLASSAAAAAVRAYSPGLIRVGSVLFSHPWDRHSHNQVWDQLHETQIIAAALLWQLQAQWRLLHQVRGVARDNDDAQ